MPHQDQREAGAAVALGATDAAAATSTAETKGTPAPLRLNRDGRYTIVQFNNTQDDELIDSRSIELMEKVLDREKPDVVVLNGDNIASGCDSALQMKQAMNNVVRPMERRGVPWVVTFGNHDEDSTPLGGLDKEDMLAFYRSYAGNRNPRSPKGITGSGNANVIINASWGNRAAFNLFLLDSGDYAPARIPGQDFEGYPQWDWVRMNQVRWYAQTSERVEREARRAVPALMFIHIPRGSSGSGGSPVSTVGPRPITSARSPSTRSSVSATRSSHPDRSTAACSPRSSTAATSRACSVGTTT